MRSRPAGPKIRATMFARVQDGPYPGQYAKTVLGRLCGVLAAANMSGLLGKKSMILNPVRPVLALACALSCCVLLPTKLSAQQQPPQRVSGNDISKLIRNTIIAVNHANLTGNYTVLRDLGSLSLNTNRSASNLADIFRPLREGKIDLANTVLHDPRLSETPRLTKNGVLQLKGWFLTKPNNVTFDLTYRFENSKWRIMSISIGMRPHVDKGAVEGN